MSLYLQYRIRRPKINFVSKLLCSSKTPTPVAIYDKLSEDIVGQRDVKISISVGLYYHILRTMNGGLTKWNSIALSNGKSVHPARQDKTNILLLGPTGSGKTQIVRSLAEIINVPVVVCDATALTQTGYIGDDVSSVVQSLYMETEDVELTQRGVIYIDEIDKTARRHSSGNSGGQGRDVSGEGVQQGLLKLLEGSTVTISNTTGLKLSSRSIQIDTSGILFICGGSFSGLESIISDRIRKTKSHNSPNTQSTTAAPAGDRFDQLTCADLIEFGMIPEFVGRFPVITSTHMLSVPELISVLHDPRNSIMKQFSYLFASLGIELVCTSQASTAIASIAHSRGTGARGLRAIVEHLLSLSLFVIPSLQEQGASTESSDKGGGYHTLIIDEKAALSQRGAILLRGNLTADEFLLSMNCIGPPCTTNNNDLYANDDRVTEVNHHLVGLGLLNT